MRARLPIASDGVRLVHGEADGLPGLVVDRYGDMLSAQFLSAGVERWKARIADAAAAPRPVRARLYERSDTRRARAAKASPPRDRAGCAAAPTRRPPR